MPIIKPVTFYQYAAFRIILGCYLIYHFATLFPYAPEMFSALGMVPNPQVLPTFGIFPDILYWIDHPIITQIFICVLLILSLIFTCGFHQRITAVLLWFGWACLINRNILIANPGMPFIGWLLLACAIIPSKKENWQMPRLVYFGAWALMALGYSVSGIHKLGSPSWLDGTALQHVLMSPLSRGNFICDIFLSLPPILIHLATWGALLLEVLFAPLCILAVTRKWVWILMVVMHMGILTMVNFADLTIGVLMIHFFTFDARWIKPLKKSKDAPIVFFDGVCAMCNGFVQFVLQESLQPVLYFSPLQGQTAKEKLPTELTTNMDSIVLLDNNQTYIQSDAILRIYRYMGGMWGLSVIFYIVPSKIRNYIYDFIAKHRYQWFGKKTDACKIPAINERQFLLP